MFTTLKTEFANRSSEVAEFWRLIDRFEKEELLHRTSVPSLRTLKGMMFVHFYSIYEYVIIQSFAGAVRLINSHSLDFANAKRHLIPLALNSHFQSISSLSDRKCWHSKTDLILKTETSDTLIIPEALFPQDESHFRAQQLDTICHVIGLTRGALLPNTRIMGWISEVVEHRNAIAHGRETPSVIGGRYTSSDLDTRRHEMALLCNHLISTLETHSSIPSNFRK